jgi:hypothetical protein
MGGTAALGGKTVSEIYGLMSARKSSGMRRALPLARSMHTYKEFARATWAPSVERLTPKWRWMETRWGAESQVVISSSSP